MKAMPRAALYMRVSTANKDQKTDSQRLALEDYCKLKGYQIVGIYEDVGQSGSKQSRPQLDRLMEDAKRGDFSTCVVFRFDRFARSTKHLLSALEEFKKLKISFVSISEAVDTSSPLGEALFTIVGAISQLELDILRERIRSGLQAARAKGKIFGKPKQRDDIQIRDLRSRGMSLRAIAKRLGISKGSVQAALCH